MGEFATCVAFKVEQRCGGLLMIQIIVNHETPTRLLGQFHERARRSVRGLRTGSETGVSHTLFLLVGKRQCTATHRKTLCRGETEYGMQGINVVADVFPDVEFFSEALCSSGS